jgi:hypothetical protein
MGCTESNISSPPYSTSQFINRSTDLNYSDFVAGDLNGKLIFVDGNILSARDVNQLVILDGNFYAKMPHLFGIATRTQSPTAINTWKAIDWNFSLGDVYGFTSQDSNCIKVQQTGHYFATFEIQFEDDSPAPSASMAVRVSQNGVEVEGSYSEVDTIKQDASQEITSLSYIEANANDVLCLEWITNDIDVNIQTNNTWATQPTVAKGFINWVHP